MAIHRTLPSPTGSPTAAGIFWDAYEWANRVTVNTTGYVSRVRFYRPGAGSEYAPTAFKIRSSSGALLLNVTGLNDGGATGWYETVPSSWVTLTAGQTYFFILEFPGGRYVTSYTDTTRGTPDAAFTWADNYSRGYMTGPGPGFFALSNNPGAWDVELDTGPAPNPDSAPPPVAEPTVGDTGPSGSLTWWLDKATTNQDSAPKATYDIVQARFGAGGDLRTVLGTIGAAVGSANLYGKALEILANVSTIAGNVVSIGTDLANLASGGVGTQLGTDVANILGGQLRDQGRANIAVGESGWVLQDDLDGAGHAFWEQAADAYVLTWTDESFPITSEIIDGVHMTWPRSHWAAACRDGAVGQHFPLNARVNDIGPVGRRMPGLLICNPAGYPFNVQAWMYTGAA